MLGGRIACVLDLSTKRQSANVTFLVFDVSIRRLAHVRSVGY